MCRNNRKVLWELLKRIMGEMLSIMCSKVSWQLMPRPLLTNKVKWLPPEAGFKTFQTPIIIQYQFHNTESNQLMLFSWGGEGSPPYQRNGRITGRDLL